MDLNHPLTRDDVPFDISTRASDVCCRVDRRGWILEHGTHHLSLERPWADVLPCSSLLRVEGLIVFFGGGSDGDFHGEGGLQRPT